MQSNRRNAVSRFNCGDKNVGRGNSNKVPSSKRNNCVLSALLRIQLQIILGLTIALIKIA